MTMNPLPPQAYTKDTLLRAYHWLQQQPVTIKEMAMTPDILVSLFLKASRDGDGSLERPSIQNFKSELKSLAGMMDSLEGPKPEPVAPPKPAPRAAPEPPPAPMARLAPEPAFEIPNFISSPSPSPSFSTSDLDPRTRAFLHEAMNDFNLSSEAEALRMLVKIGFEKTRSFLKT